MEHQQQSGTTSDHPPADLVGSVLAGRYRILEKLGEGAMGVVYLGEHVQIGRRDAIKVLRGSLQTDAEALARFNRGARNVSAVLHPNVCTLYDYSTTENGIPFLAMELIRGESLKDVLDREGILPLHRAIGITVQIAGALQAAHDAGVVHRDLKPGNVMLCPGRDGSDVVKVVDFDIAKGAQEEEREVTRFGFVVGTPEYMSPEQLSGDRLDGRSDLYSLGLILFRMLTGSLPTRAESTQEMMVQRLTQDPLRLSDVPTGRHYPAPLEQVLDRALARAREGRQPDVESFAREVVAAVGSAGADSGTPTPGSRSPERRPTLPETRVAPALDHRSTAPQERSSDGATGGVPLPSRKPVLLAGAVGAAAVVAVLAWRLLAGGPDTGSAGEMASLQPDTTLPAEVPGSAGVIALAEEEDSNSGGTDAGSGAQGAGGGGRAQEPAADVVAPPVQRFSNAEADDILFRQQEHLYGSNASPRVMEAVKDTAGQLFRRAEASSQVKARAAYTMGLALIESGDSAAALDWVSQAVAMDPGQAGYMRLLELLRGSRR